MKDIHLSRALKIILLCIFLLVLPMGAGFYKYLYTKDFYYLLETKCDSGMEICFSRDCSNVDDCPPNGLSEYKIIQVKAYEFIKCLDDSCEEECSSGIIACTELKCDETASDLCTKLAHE